MDEVFTHFHLITCFAGASPQGEAFFIWRLLLPAEYIHPNTVVFDEDIGGEAGKFHCDVQVTCGA